VLPQQKESKRRRGRRSFVSAQGLVALLFKTAPSQTARPTELCTSLQNSGTSAYSPRFHFREGFGGCLPALSREPWEIAPAGWVCSWCDAQDPLSWAVPRTITRPPHCCLAWAIGECSRQGEGWAAWGRVRWPGGF